MTEDDIVEALCFDFGGDLCERIKYVKLCCKVILMETMTACFGVSRSFR